MDENEGRILAFLASMGIEAKFTLSNTLEKLIAIPIDQFTAHREWVERWFILVDQDENYCYLRERMRGTGGDTR